MEQGTEKRQKRARRRGRMVAAALILLMGCGLGGTLAHLIANTAPIRNVFTLGGVLAEIVETLQGGTKGHVMVRNTGDVDAFIRAAIVVNWVDEDGNAAPQMPTKSDYDLDLTASGWVQQGDYYYYTERVAPQKTTDVLIGSCREVDGAAPAGYTLQVTVLAEAIQADGVDEDGRKAVEAAWGVDPTALAD
jgi:hypothetical protein